MAASMLGGGPPAFFSDVLVPLGFISEADPGLFGLFTNPLGIYVLVAAAVVQNAAYWVITHSAEDE
eukprot:gene8835-8993_t